MIRFFSFGIGWLSILTLVMGCNSIQKSGSKNQEIQILEVYQSHVIRGAGAPKGMKIGIKVLTPNQQTLDSLTYQAYTKKLETLKTLNDTTWSEVFYYPKNETTGKYGPSPGHQFVEKTGTLHYTAGNKTKNLPISDMIMRTDNTFWK